ncbi:MAG TPA: hypothetical protein VFL13_02380 [Candidatus Baltobacteraceae bacterium]|nr:hypothetical protein [Candidatus Baltobacteraceae bacterium]
MNNDNNSDELINEAKQRLNDAVRETQRQSQEAAVQLGGLLRIGAKKLREAADAAGKAIANDINKRG